MHAIDRTRGPRRAHRLLAAVVAVAACEGGITHTGAGALERSEPPSATELSFGEEVVDAGTAPDVVLAPPAADALPAEGGPAAAPDAGALPAVGEPCAAWECAAGAICFMGVCRKACRQSVPNCNAEVAACGPDQACIAGASSFDDVCYPAEAGLHELCGPANGKQCLPGHLCVEVDGEPARCLRLCQHGCPTTPVTQCEQTTNGCSVCIPYW